MNNFNKPTVHTFYTISFKPQRHFRVVYPVTPANCYSGASGYALTVKIGRGKNLVFKVGETLYEMSTDKTYQELQASVDLLTKNFTDYGALFLDSRTGEVVDPTSNNAKNYTEVFDELPSWSRTT